MKKVPFKKPSFLLVWLMIFSVSIPFDGIAEKESKSLSSDGKPVSISLFAPGTEPELTTDVSGQIVVPEDASQEHVGILRNQLDLFKEAVERFRSCLVERNCSQEERSVVVDMANMMLQLALIGVGVGVVQTGEFVSERMHTVKGVRK